MGTIIAHSTTGNISINYSLSDEHGIFGALKTTTVRASDADGGGRGDYKNLMSLSVERHLDSCCVVVVEDYIDKAIWVFVYVSTDECVIYC